MICKECVFYNGRKCLLSNRVRFWFDGYNCKHANNGELNKIKASEYGRFTVDFALQLLTIFLKSFTK